MQTITYILKDIQPFMLKDDIVQMMKTFDQYPFSHLPVVDAKLFYGAISREEVEMIITEKLKLNDFKKLDDAAMVDHGNGVGQFGEPISGVYLKSVCMGQKLLFALKAQVGYAGWICTHTMNSLSSSATLST